MFFNLELQARATLCLGTVAALLYPLLDTTAGGDYWYFSIALIASAGAIRGALTPRLSRPRLALALFLVLQVAGGLIQANSDDDGSFALQFSTADLLFIFSYIMASLGLVPTHGLSQPCRTSGWIDAMTVLLGLMLIGWKLLLFPTLSGHSGLAWETHPAQLRVWYPIWSFVLLAQLTYLSATGSIWGRHASFLRWGLLIWSVAESSFHLTSLSVDIPLWWVRTAWLLAYLLIGVAMLSRSPRASTHDGDGRITSPDPFFILLPLLCVVVLTWKTDILSGAADRIITTVTATLLTILIWLRITLIQRLANEQHTHLLHAANTDPVSGAMNRHGLDQVLAEACGAKMPEPPLTLLVLQISHAPHLSHADRDTIIASACRVLKRTAQQGDLVARIADHQLARLSRGRQLPEANHTEAWLIQNELRDDLAENPFSAEAGLRLHIGIATPNDGEGGSELLDTACHNAELARRNDTLVICDGEIC